MNWKHLFSYIIHFQFFLSNKSACSNEQEKMQQRDFHSVITFNAFWLNRQNDPRPICVMAQGPGAPSPLAASEVFLQEPSTQLLPLWLPALPWLPAETLLHSLLGGKSFLLIRLKCLLTWAEKQRGKNTESQTFQRSPVSSVLPPRLHD